MAEDDVRKIASLLHERNAVDDVVVAPHTVRAIPARDVLALYQIQGWWPERTLQQISIVLANGPAVAAWQKDKIIAFARAVTDGIFRHTSKMSSSCHSYAEPASATP